MPSDRHRRKKGRPTELPVDLAKRIGAPDPGDAAPAPAPETPSPPGEPTPVFVAPRQPPGAGELDLVVTPLPTPDDWHRFELALRNLKGVSRVQPQYYRHGVLKVRMAYSGDRRLAQALRDLPGYRVRVIGEDRHTLQILVAPDTDERRPG